MNVNILVAEKGGAQAPLLDPPLGWLENKMAAPINVLVRYYHQRTNTSVKNYIEQLIESLPSLQ